MPGDVQAADVNSIRPSAEFSVNVIGPADPARTELDTINTAYRQTLSAFNTFVCRITTVVFLVDGIEVLIDDTHRSIHTLRWRSVPRAGFRRYLFIMLDAF